MSKTKEEKQKNKELKGKFDVMIDEAVENLWVGKYTSKVRLKEQFLIVAEKTLQFVKDNN